MLYITMLVCLSQNVEADETHRSQGRNGRRGISSAEWLSDYFTETLYPAIDSGVLVKQMRLFLEESIAGCMGLKRVSFSMAFALPLS